MNIFLVVFLVVVGCLAGVAVLVAYLTGSAVWGWAALLAILVAWWWRGKFKTPHERYAALLEAVEPPELRKERLARLKEHETKAKEAS